jgi:hypothetical protein
VLRTEQITTADGRYRVTDKAARRQYERYHRPSCSFASWLMARPARSLRPGGRVRSKTPEPPAARLQPRCLPPHSEEEIASPPTSRSHVYSDEEDFVLNEPKCLVLTYGAPPEAPVESTRAVLQPRVPAQVGEKHEHRQFSSEQVTARRWRLSTSNEDTGAIIASAPPVRPLRRRAHPQLGLPLLLDARHVLHPDGLQQHRSL